MPKNYTSSVVFVGRNFNISLFDERDLVGEFGSLKQGDQIKAGPVGRFNYEHGYHFSVVPDRIDIRHTGQDILPEPLLTVGKKIAHKLEHLIGFVSAVGINCDTVFDSHEVGMRGSAFCGALTENHLFRRIHKGCPNAATLSVATTFKLDGGRIHQYNLRFEPDKQSAHERLHVSFNAHQNVTIEDKLTEILDESTINEVRSQIEQLHTQIPSSGDVQCNM